MVIVSHPSEDDLRYILKSRIKLMKQIIHLLNQDLENDSKTRAAYQLLKIKFEAEEGTLMMVKHTGALNDLALRYLAVISRIKPSIHYPDGDFYKKVRIDGLIFAVRELEDFLESL